MIRSAVMPADMVGRNFSRDPELQLPETPRLPPELVVRPFGTSSLLFDGARGLQVLGGRSARTLLPRVLALLDGTRTLEQIAALLPNVHAEGVHDIVSLLHSRGLLENGSPPPPPPGLEDVDALLGRFVDVTRANRNRQEALDRLRAAKVVVAGGSASVTALLHTQLMGLGIGELRTLDRSVDALAGATLLVAASTREDEDPGSLFDAAQERSVWALHVRVAARSAQIGPLFVPGKSACYRCLREIHGRPPAGDADPETLGLWLGLATFQTFQLLSRMADPYLYNVVHHYESTPHGVIPADRIVVRMPGCRRCGIEAARIDPRSPGGLAWLLHGSTSMPPRELLSPRAHQNHYSATNIAITRELSEPYYGAPSVALPEPARLSGPLPWLDESGRSPSVDVSQLATLLFHAAGYQETAAGGRWRVAPTGGGLGSPEMFVVAKGVAGLEDGTYHYHSPRHCLERLQSASPALVHSALGWASAPDAFCTIVGTGALGKLRSKYANFSYRLVNLDAGVALGYLHDVAAALGVAVHEYPRMHDRALAEALCLPTVGHRNVLTFAIGVGGLSDRPSDGVLNLGPQILDAVIDLAASPAGTTAAADSRGLPLLSMPVLPTFGEALLGRRSVRSYSEEPVAEDAVRMVAGAAGEMARLRLTSGAAPAGVRVWLALNAPAGSLGPGVYRVDLEDTTSLRQERATCRPDETVRCLLQKGLGLAPVMLFVTGNFPSAVGERGPRGYRELLLQAGAVVGRSLVAATAWGLAACPSGGMMEDGFRSLANLDGYRDCPLFAAAVGHALDR